jgi:hypothetical protein
VSSAVLQQWIGRIAEKFNYVLLHDTQANYGPLYDTHRLIVVGLKDTPTVSVSAEGGAPEGRPERLAAATARSIQSNQSQGVAMKQDQAHPLEFNAAEREWFLTACGNYVTAWRRGVEAATGSLPTWAERQSAGRPQSISTKHHEEIRELLALGVPVSKVAARFNVSRPTVARIRGAAKGAAQ